MKLIKNSVRCVQNRMPKFIKDACGGLTCETGGINVGKLWQLKKEIIRHIK